MRTGIVVIGMLLAVTCDASEVQGWPCWRGPHNNGSAIDPGMPIVDDLAQAKLVWTSAQGFPPMAGTKHVFKEDHEFFFYGGYGDPIVVDDKVYVFYYRPSGPVDESSVAAYQQERMPDPSKAKDERKRKKAEEQVLFMKKHIPECYKMDADDVLVCLDASTGETLWTREFLEQGFNYNIANGQAYTIHGIPCYGDGRVFALGTGAVVHAVDAETGEPAWSTPVGPAADNMARWKTKYRETGKVTKDQGEMKKTMCQTIVYAGGVVACSDVVGATKNMRGGPARGGAHCGMAGFDAKTGERLWTVPDCIATYNAPLPWRHEGKTYFIGSNLDNIKCIEARSGEVVWTKASADGHVVHSGGMNGAIAGDLLLLEDLVEVSGEGKRRRGQLGLSCYRLTPAGPEQLWRFDCGSDMEAGANDKTGMSPLIHRGHAYFQNPGRNKATWCIDMQTGKAVTTIAEQTGMRYGNTVGIGDKILTPGGLFGTGTDFKALGRSRGAIKATAYCGPTIVGAHLFTRDNYRVYCYDLRR